MVFLGNLVDAAGIICLSDKGLAHTFHCRSSPRSLADFLLVVSIPSQFIIVTDINMAQFLMLSKYKTGLWYVA